MVQSLEKIIKGSSPVPVMIFLENDGENTKVKNKEIIEYLQ